MVQAKLSTVVKTVRFRYAVAFVLLLTAVYWIAIHPWMANWGATPAERGLALPGDDLNSPGARLTTQAITIHAPPAVVWQWLAQVGQDRAGFYTYTWLENLTGANIHNANQIQPEWQHLAVGDAWRLVPADYLGELGKNAASPVLMVEPGRALVLQMFGAYVLLPVDEGATRLLLRGSSGPANPMQTLVADPLVFTMGRRMLLGLQARAEGRPDASPGLTALAQIGWAAAGIAIAALFLVRRRRRYWLALPVAAALLPLVTSRDAQAALAAFLAAGIIVLGFLIYGRRWWGPLLVIASVVLLTLLLAPDAYIALGVAFAILLLAALGATIAERASARGGAAVQAEGQGGP